MGTYVLTPTSKEEQAEQDSSRIADPIRAAMHLRPPARGGLEERFKPTDPQIELSKNSLVKRILKDRRFQFFLILPNQIIFWAVILIGILGTVVPGLNFGSAITWYIWFCLVFVMMVVVGRAWCSMCPFGGFAEWIQRHAFWKRKTSKPLTLGWKLPESWAGYGLLISVATFIGLTWIEEFFNIAGPGTPSDTSWMVVGIVVSAVAVFLLFERRTFCRYICPLSSLIGTISGVGMAAGFRTKDRETCLNCPTKDCMRGGEEGYGCPWYTWPGSADSNLLCGLCSECYKSCPSDNVGFFIQKPLTSLINPLRRRLDVAWVIALLFGLVVFQQINALNWYTPIDNWLNKVTGVPHYPNPFDYIGFILLGAAILAGAVWLIRQALPGGSSGPDPALAIAKAAGLSSGPGAAAVSDSSFAANAASPAVVGGYSVGQAVSTVGSGTMSKAKASFRQWFMPIMYGLIPVMGSDYLARQLPKFFKHSPRLISSVAHLFGARAGLYHVRLLSNNGIIAVQVAVVAAGTLASVYAMWKIAHRDLAPLTARLRLAQLFTVVMVLLVGAGVAICYVAMHAAS